IYNKTAGQNPSNAEVNTPGEQSGEEAVVDPAPQVAKPGTEEPQKPVDETPVVDEVVEQPLVETPVEPDDEAPAVEYIPVAQEEEIEPTANQQTETGTEPEAEEPQGIAGANVSASGYGKSVDVGVDTAVSGVQADVSGQSVESSTAHGVVVNDTEL